MQRSEVFANAEGFLPRTYVRMYVLSQEKKTQSILKFQETRFSDFNALFLFLIFFRIRQITFKHFAAIIISTYF
jgi:hypothetical protein